jgi:hypothetical protein
MALEEIKGCRGAEGRSGDIGPQKGQMLIDGTEYCRGGKRAVEAHRDVEGTDGFRGDIGP